MPCIYLGKVLEQKRCNCDRKKVRTCAIHGRCSQDRTKEPHCCEDCNEYVADS